MTSVRRNACLMPRAAAAAALAWPGIAKLVSPASGGIGDLAAIHMWLVAAVELGLAAGLLATSTWFVAAYATVAFCVIAGCWAFLAPSGCSGCFGSWAPGAAFRVLYVSAIGATCATMILYARIAKNGSLGVRVGDAPSASPSDTIRQQ